LMKFGSTTHMRHPDFGELENLSLLQYVLLSIVISVLAVVFLGLLLHDSETDFVFWVLTALAGGTVLGLVEYVMIRRLRQRRPHPDATKASVVMNRRGRS
jgi:membrane protein DedA with SNARE-associated domain